MATRFQKARFSIEYGPESLFARINYKMKDVVSLTLTKHAKQRLTERNIPEFAVNKIKNFSVNDWRLKCGEVRIDSGKFVNSTWEYIYNNEQIRITIGFGNVVETVVIKESNSLNNIVKEGQLFNFVDEVNSELMKNV